MESIMAQAAVTASGKRPLKQLLFHFSTKEEINALCVEFGGTWASYRFAYSLSRPSFHVEKGQSSTIGGCRQD